MGNAFCCSCPSCQKQESSIDIMQALENMQSINMGNVDDLIQYIDELRSRIDTGGYGPINRPTSVDFFINSGHDLTKTFSNRLNRHVGKKYLLSAVDRRTIKFLSNIAGIPTQPIPYVGMAFSIIADLLERREQFSSNDEHIIQLLYSMSDLAKHMRNLVIHLPGSNLDDKLHLIVKGTLMCALQMEPTKVCRYISAPLDAAELERFKFQLDSSYQNLALEGVTVALERLPHFPGHSQGEYPRNAVAIVEAQNRAIELLDLNDASHRVVVIYGFGGIGKTTLANAVFYGLDLTCYHHCRVEMDQDSKLSDLLLKQEQILRDVFKENLKLNDCTQGRAKLSEAFKKASKPVFLYIDNALRRKDIEELLPIEHLARLPVRSRIFITTRNLIETYIFEHQGGIPVCSHRVDSVSEPEAKRILSHYALGDANGSFDLEVNIDGLLKICEGIPLVLRIVGCELRRCGKNVSACNEYIKEWQREGFEGGEEDLSERLVDFVYKRLKGPSKEAFLDIAAFFYDWERSKVGDIVGEMELEDLEGAALVTASQERPCGFFNDMLGKRTEVKVKMHDIVRARGRKLSEGTRITDREYLSDLLSDAQKLKQTKGIWLRQNNSDDSTKNWYSGVFGQEFRLEAKHLDLMSSTLRVLCLGHVQDDHTKVNGRCERPFGDLRFLSILCEDMLPVDLTTSSRLAFFCGSFMKGSEAKLNLPKSLRLLYIDGEASGFPVWLEHLTSLREIALSNITLANFETCISQLKSLRRLLFSECEDLTSIPESLGNFSCLKILKLHDISKLERLPESFGNLSSVQKLDISYCSMLERLPDSFGNLSSVKNLNISNCSMLKRLPESFGNLSSVQKLDISNCSMLGRLPDSFGNLSSMKYLKMSKCSRLERFPQTFDQLSCLKELKMDGCEKMCSLLDNFGQLTCLKFLDISNCKELKRLPNDIQCLTSLAGMKAYGCAQLEAEAMDSLVEIKSLMFLEMGESPMLIKRWEQIQHDRPPIGASLRFLPYPHEEIMSAMLFNGGSRFLHVDGEGQLAEVGSSSFPEVGLRVGLLLTSCDLSNELRQKLVEVASRDLQIMYVDVEGEAEGEGSGGMEEREERIRRRLVQLPQEVVLGLLVSIKPLSCLRIRSGVLHLRTRRWWGRACWWTRRAEENSPSWRRYSEEEQMSATSALSSPLYAKHPIGCVLVMFRRLWRKTDIKVRLR